MGDIACITLSAIDDDLIETTEQFTLSLDDAEAVSVVNNKSEVTVNIEDNEGRNNKALSHSVAGCSLNLLNVHVRT